MQTTKHSPKRIAVLTPDFFPEICGVGDHTLRLAERLLALGHQVSVWSRPPASTVPALPGLEVHQLHAPGGGLKAWEALPRLLRHRPDVVLVQYTPHMLGATRLGNWGIPGLVQGLRLAGVPVVLIGHELHATWSLRPDAMLATVTHLGELGLLLQAASRFVVSLESRQEMLQRRFGRLADEVVLVPVPSNAEPLPEQPREGFAVGSFSGLAGGKRWDLLLDAFAIIAREAPEATLWLLGDLVQDSAASRALQAQVAAHPARERIHLPGRQSLQEIAAEVGKLSVFLLPTTGGATTRSGTLPLAFGAGTPVVARNGHETGSLFRDRENVLFIRELDASALAEGALELRRDRALWAKLAEGGRALYQRHLDWDVVVPALLGPYA